MDFGLVLVQVIGYGVATLLLSVSVVQLACRDVAHRAPLGRDPHGDTVAHNWRSARAFFNSYLVALLVTRVVVSLLLGETVSELIWLCIAILGYSLVLRSLVEFVLGVVALVRRKENGGGAYPAYYAGLIPDCSSGPDKRRAGWAFRHLGAAFVLAAMTRFVVGA